MQFVKNNNLQKLTKSSSHLDRILKYGPKEDLLYIWSRISDLPEWNNQRTASANLSKYILLKYGTNKLPKPFTIYTHNINTDKYFIKTHAIKLRLNAFEGMSQMKLTNTLKSSLQRVNL